MVIELFNFWYFFYIFIGIGLYFGLYFLLRKRSKIVKNLVIGGLLIFNLALHFLKLTFHPYTTYPEIAASQIWFVNMCAVSILVFPFIFFSKSKTLKDFMFYLGVLSGFLAVVFPADNLQNPAFALDSIRFYTAHFIIIIAPLLMITLKLHTVSYKRIGSMPLLVGVYLLFIMVQNVIQSELGIIAFRSANFFKPNYHNPSFVWGPTNSLGEFSDLAKLFTPFTPKFLKTVPFGIFKGQEKYWPFFWIMPAAFVYFWSLPLIFVLIIPHSRKELFTDIKALFAKIKKIVKREPKVSDDYPK